MPSTAFKITKEQFAALTKEEQTALANRRTAKIIKKSFIRPGQRKLSLNARGFNKHH